MKLALLIALLATPADTVRQGHEAFWQGDFDAAAQAYRSATEAAPLSADLWYDLGTAEANAGRPGPAIHAFEQALLLRPGDADAEHNLEVVRAMAVDRGLAKGADGRVILPGDDDTGTGLLTALTPGTVAWTFAAAWALLFGLLILWRRAQTPARRTALASGAVLMGLVALAAGALMLGSIHLLRDARFAVVLDEQVTVQSGPGQQYKPSAEVLGGVKLRIRGEEREWRHVLLPDGSEGWLPAKALAELRRP